MDAFLFLLCSVLFVRNDKRSTKDVLSAVCQMNIRYRMIQIKPLQPSLMIFSTVSPILRRALSGIR